MEIKLKGRDLPRNEKGDVEFKCLGPLYVPNEDRFPTCPNCPEKEHSVRTVINVFNPQEIVELVNRALYQLEYQRESHRKRGQAERDRHKALKEALKAAGKDVKVETISKQLKGE